jgi:hypothetical protein
MIEVDDIQYRTSGIHRHNHLRRLQEICTISSVTGGWYHSLSWFLEAMPSSSVIGGGRDLCTTRAGFGSLEVETDMSADGRVYM